MSAAFARYIGIDYSGAETCESSLKGLRVYTADHVSEAREIPPPRSPRKNWSRKGIACWLVERLSEALPTLAGIDHGFSFPLRYFETYDLPRDWSAFLDDFQAHWPTDEDITYVDFVREGECGKGAARCGNSHWRRITEVRVGAKSVFHFDVPGSVAKSTRASLGCALSACEPETEFISGHSMAGMCRRASQQSSKFIPRCGATVSRAMAAIPIGRTPTPQRNGFGGATWMAVPNVSLAPA